MKQRNRAMKKAAALLSVVAMMVSMFTAVTFAQEGEREYILKQTYEQFELGKNASGSNWQFNYGLAGRHYVTVEICKNEDAATAELKTNGTKYLTVQPSDSTPFPGAVVAANAGDEGYTPTPIKFGYSMKKDFVEEVSVCMENGKAHLVISPAGDAAVTDPCNAGAHSVLDLTTNAAMKAYNGSSVVDTGYTTAANTWYNFLFDVKYNGGINPTCSIYVKMMGETKYTLIAENYALSSGDYSGGVAVTCFALLDPSGGNKAYFDDLLLYYPETDFEVEAYPVGRDYLYRQDYERYNVGQYLYTQSANSSSWYANIGGSYGEIYIRNDATHGNSLKLIPVNPTQQLVLTSKGANSHGTAAGAAGKGLTMTEDFIVKTKFYNQGQLEFNLYPLATLPGSNGCDDACKPYKLATLNRNAAVTVYNGSTAVTTDYTTVDGWYDLLIDTKMGTTPTYSVMIKQESEDAYTCIAKDLPYPSGDYSKGVSTYSLMRFSAPGGYKNLYLDDTEVFYPEPGFSVPIRPDFTVAATGDYEIQKTNLQDGVYTKASGDEFDYYAMRFVFALTLKEGASASDVQNFGAYMIPWDKLAQGTAIQDSTAKISSYNALDYPITQTVSTFSVDMVGIPKAAVGRTLYVAPFVNGSVQLDGAYKEVIQNN